MQTKKTGPAPAKNNLLLLGGGVLLILVASLLLLIGLAAMVYFLGSQQAPASSILDNAVLFEGSLPEPGPVTYTTKDGDAFTAPRAYPGFVALYTELGTPKEVVEQAIASNSGTVVESLPEAGLWTVQVDAGSESDFMASLFLQPWFLDGTPLQDFSPKIIHVYDMFSKRSPPQDCGIDHGELTQARAGRLGGQTIGVNVPHGRRGSIIRDMMKQVQEAQRTGTNLVFSMSLGSVEDDFDTVQDRTGCEIDKCKLARRGQRLFFQTFLQAFEAQIRKTPASTDHAILVISAGNGGVDLDAELSYLQRKYPLAYRQVKIVGATDSSGRVDPTMDHTSGTDPSTIVYGLGNDVPIRPGIFCTGTSFSAPEISGVLDHLWAANPQLTARQIIDAFDDTLAQTGSNVVPHDTDGSTTQSFLDAATSAIQQEVPEPTIVSPIGGGTDNGGATTVPGTDLEFIVPGQLPSGTVGEEYTYYFCDPGATQGEACGAFEEYMYTPTGGHPPYTFTLDANTGFPPMGLALMINGELKGTPTAEGQSTFGVCATDLSQNRVCQRTTLTIEPEEETGCSSPYDGTWRGTRTVKGVQHWIGPWNGDTYPTEDRPFTVSYTLEITVKCYSDFEDESNEWNHDVLTATVSDPFFGCQSGCDASEGGSNLQVPNPGQVAAYPNFALYFPNGATLSADPINISPDAKTITLEGGMVGYGPEGSIEQKNCPDCLSTDIEQDTFILTKVD